MTYEEFVEIMDNSNFMIDSSNPYDMKILEELEKQIPKKPNEVLGLNGKEFCCPYCDEEIELIPWDKDETTYCLHCGQRLDFRSESIDNEDE